MIDDQFVIDEIDTGTGLQLPGPWQAWTWVFLGGGVLVLLVAGRLLAGGSLGTSLAARGCDAGVLGAIALLFAGAALVVAGCAVARLRHPGAQLAIDWSTLAYALPLPVALLAATTPAVAGCRAARGFDNLPLLGDALVGPSAIVLAGCAAALVATALGSALAVGWVAPAVSVGEQHVGIVELAIREAEALDSDQGATRFRNVDDE